MMRNFAAIFVPLLAMSVLVKSHTLEDDCPYWKQVADALSNMHQPPTSYAPKMYMNCLPGCANISCTGNFKMSNLFGQGALDVDYCFGIQQNPCVDPVAIQYYVSIPKQNISMAGNLTHSTTYELPVPSMGALLSDVTIILNVEMVKLNQSAIKLKIDVKVKVMEGIIPIFPLQKTIFPETVIDVPECPQDRSQLLKFKAPQTCTALPPPAITSTQAPVDVKSATYHKSCEFGLAKCNATNEMCVAKNDLANNGVCQCVPGASMSRVTGYCELKNTQPTQSNPAAHTQPAVRSTQIPSVTQKPNASHGTNLIPIIIGSVVSVVVLIVVGILVLVFVGRRKRIARYRDRQQLLSDDMMDEEDDNLVI